jgi:predicted CXXCH cytochrome family protein
VRHLLIVSALCMALAAGALGQMTDILGSHNLQGGGGSPVTGALPPCLFCHAPHSSQYGAQGLWSQKLSTVNNYTLYSGTLNPVQQPTLGSVSNQCLSCHDGTVAPGQTSPYGNIAMKGAMAPNDVFHTDLSSVHPFNFKLPLDPTTPNMLPSVLGGSGTGNPAVKLIDRNVQCTSCHEPHNQFIDSSNMFLVTDNTGSALCLACHQTDPGVSLAASSSIKARFIEAGFTPSTPNTLSTSIAPSTTGVALKDSLHNSLNSWKLSAHARGAHKTRRGSPVSSYGTVARNGCASCHTAHGNAKGAALLIQSTASDALSLDVNTRNCVTCHDGGNNISPALPNILAEFNKPGHPLPASGNTHQTRESGLLNGNRHATCVDCHNPHASKQAGSYSMTTLRPAQTGANGISENDGSTVLHPAQYQFQTCLRCHGTSSGKKVMSQFGYAPNFAVTSGDPLNELSQFGRTARSSHPVMHDRNSGLPQPSLLSSLKNLDGKTQGRPMGNRILCSDCHNSDDSRESGGSGPSGPHGSVYPHILERRYEMSQVAPAGGAGSLILNLYPNPSLDASCSTKPCLSPYALCAKCHDLTKLSSSGSFSEHARHINDGFSCSVCHSAHGVGAGSSGVSGERLVNFDVNVVGAYKGQAITYSRGANSCTLVCHNHTHTGKTTPVLGHPAALAR